MKKLSFFLLLFLSFGFVSLRAASVSRVEAQLLAERFFAGRGKVLSGASVSAYSLAGSATEDSAPLYVFNADGGEGFVIISGNSLTGDVLGYSDSGEFDVAAVGENCRAWLEYYAAEIAWVAEHEGEYLSRQMVTPYATKTRHAIAPLLTCLWGQGAPFNDLCPRYTSSSGVVGGCATGCVATAIAQVIYSYKYPSSLAGSIPAYSLSRTTSDGYTISASLPAIPAGTKLDWDNMLDSYEGSYSEAQAQAVAELNLYIGQSLEMIYGPSSGSSFYNAKRLFEDHFGFASGATRVYTEDYEIQAWLDLIYGELAAGYPIAYGGNASSGGTSIGGHAFVIDGYDGEGFFHVNWGWSGGSNGYFRLTVLDSGDGSRPDLDASASGYCVGQDAMVYIRPQGQGVEDMSAETLTVTSASVMQSTNIRVIYQNATAAARSYDCAIVVRDSDGQYVSVGDVITEDAWAAGSSKSEVFDMTTCFSAPGEYRLSPASRLSGTATWYSYWTLTSDEYILATVADDLSVTLKLCRHTEDVSITDWTFTGSLAANAKQYVIVTFANAGGEYKNNNVGLYMIAPGATNGTMASQAGVGVASGGESKVRYFFTPTTAGTWTLYVSDGTTEFGRTTVDIASTATLWPLELTKTTIDNDCYGSRLTGSVTIKNNADEAFTGQIRISLYHRQPSGSATEPASTIVDVSDVGAGRTASLAFNFAGLTIGDSYDIVVRNYATNTDGSVTNGNLSWKWPYVLKEGVLQWSNDGAVSGSSAKSALSPATSVAGIYCEGVSHDVITPSRNTNTVYAFAGTAPSEGLDGCNVVVDGTAEQITFANNGYAAYLPVSFTAGEITYRHTFTTVSEDGVAGWEALTLPFKPDGVRLDGVDATWKQGDGDGDFYLREFSYEDDLGTVIFEDVPDVASLWANAPYVIAATEAAAGKTVEFYATNATVTATTEAVYVASTDDYYFYGTTLRVREGGIYTLNDDGSAYEYKSGTTSVSPFENYFVSPLPEGQRPATIAIAAATTGIHQVGSAAAQNDNVYYDLQGRPLRSPTKGVYILNGKKYVK